MEGTLLVITGPSGVGKGTILDLLRQRMPELHYSVSATTRQPRNGEEEGVHYCFISETEFEAKIANGEFVEHAQYSGDYYGTLYAEIKDPMRQGRPVILEIELEGARQIKRSFPEAVMIFIEPPSPEVLAERLRLRGTEEEDAILRRLRNAERELAARDEFDYRVENDNLGRAVDDLEEIVRRVANL